MANEEFNKKEDEFDKALFDLFKKYKKISKYLKSTKQENNELLRGLRNSFKSKLEDIKKDIRVKQSMYKLIKSIELEQRNKKRRIHLFF